MLATAGLGATYASKGVRVVGVSPSLTETDRVAEGLAADARLANVSMDEARRRNVARHRLRRWIGASCDRQMAVGKESGRAGRSTRPNYDWAPLSAAVSLWRYDVVSQADHLPGRL